MQLPPKSFSFEIKHRIIAKKNSKRLITRGGRRFVVPSENYEVFKRKVFTDLESTKFPQLKPPYACSYQIFMKGKQFADLDNMIASINDIMEEWGVIENDRHVLKYVEPTEAVPENKDWLAIVTVYGH